MMVEMMMIMIRHDDDIGMCIMMMLVRMVIIVKTCMNIYAKWLHSNQFPRLSSIFILIRHQFIFNYLIESYITIWMIRSNWWRSNIYNINHHDWHYSNTNTATSTNHHYLCHHRCILINTIYKYHRHDHRCHYHHHIHYVLNFLQPPSFSPSDYRSNMSLQTVALVQSMGSWSCQLVGSC